MDATAVSSGSKNLHQTVLDAALKLECRAYLYNTLMSHRHIINVIFLYAPQLLTMFLKYSRVTLYEELKSNQLCHNDESYILSSTMCDNGW